MGTLSTFTPKGRCAPNCCCDQCLGWWQRQLDEVGFSSNQAQANIQSTCVMVLLQCLARRSPFPEVREYCKKEVTKVNAARKRWDMEEIPWEQ